jgi:hypothetical protein
MQLISVTEFGGSLETYVIFVACLLLVNAPWWVLLLGKSMVRLSNRGIKEDLDSATICFGLSGIGSFTLILSLMLREFYPFRVPGDSVFSAVAFLSMFSIVMMTFSAIVSATFLSSATRLKTREFEFSHRYLLLVVVALVVPAIVLSVLMQLFPDLVQRLVLASYVWMIMLAGGVVLFCFKAWINALAAKNLLNCLQKKQAALVRAMRLQVLCSLFSLPVIAGLAWSAYLFYSSSNNSAFAQVIAAECLWHFGLIGINVSIFLSMDFGKVTDDSIDIIK